MFAMKAVSDAGNQPVGAGAKGDIAALDMHTPVVVGEGMVHAELRAVNRVVSQQDVGTLPDLDSRATALHQADDEAVARDNMRKGIGLQLDVQEVLVVIYLVDRFDKVDRSRFELAFVGVDRKADVVPNLGLLLVGALFHRGLERWEFQHLPMQSPRRRAAAAEAGH